MTSMALISTTNGNKTKQLTRRLPLYQLASTNSHNTTTASGRKKNCYHETRFFLLRGASITIWLFVMRRCWLDILSSLKQRVEARTAMRLKAPVPYFSPPPSSGNIKTTYFSQCLLDFLVNCPWTAASSSPYVVGTKKMMEPASCVRSSLLLGSCSASRGTILLTWHHQYLVTGQPCKQGRSTSSKKQVSTLRRFWMLCLL